MPVLNPNTSAGQTARDIITDALIEIGAIAQGEVIPDNDGQWCLRKLNRLVDQWAGRELFIYDQLFTEYTLTPNLSPHTIGPTGTFVVAVRPTRIVAANLILNNVTPAIDVPLRILDNDQWAEEVLVKDLISMQPTKLYYGPSWPNGELNFWPIPTTAYGVRLETWSTLTQFADLGTAFTMPQGYWNAVVLALAVQLWPSYWKDQSISPVLVKSAMDAVAAVQSNNSEAPLLMTSQAGMAPSKRGTFNYRTGY